MSHCSGTSTCTCACACPASGNSTISHALICTSVACNYLCFTCCMWNIVPEPQQPHLIKRAECLDSIPRKTSQVNGAQAPLRIPSL